MTSLWRRVYGALTRTGPGYDTVPLPARGDHVEAWLKAQRDLEDPQSHEWHVIDTLLDRYRLHAATATPLTEHVCGGMAIDDCDCYPADADVAVGHVVDYDWRPGEPIECIDDCPGCTAGGTT